MSDLENPAAQTGTIEEMVQYVFSHSVQPPGYYKLDIDFKENENNPEEAQIQFFKDVFNYGMAFLYGYSDLLDLSQDEFENLNFYMKSLGVKFIVTANGTIDDPWVINARGEKLDFMNITLQLL